MIAGPLLFRADANVAMGTGHVMRCLALAQAWQDAGGRCIFAMADTTMDMRDRLLSEGIQVAPIEVPAASEEDGRQVQKLARDYEADWVVVDGYHFGARYERELKAGGLKLLFLDDDGSAERRAADLILNQNFHATESMYKQREPYTRLLLGTRYALLRREFSARRDWKRVIPQPARKLLITMGGSDPDNITGLAIAALGMVKTEGLQSTIIAGGSNPHFESLRKTLSNTGSTARLEESASNMPELMAETDIAIIAGGGTLWELLYMSCPVLSFARNEVQGRILTDLHKQGIVQYLGDPAHFKPAMLALAIDELAASREQRAAMAELGRQHVDGEGAKRVCELLGSHAKSQAQVKMVPVLHTDRQAFLHMAEQHFRDLDPAFVPRDDWKEHYFEKILANSRLFARWIMRGGQRTGFILFGLEDHRFLPRLTGVVYELYVLPEFRRMGIAGHCAVQAIRELEAHRPSKIQLEVLEGNAGAEALWHSLGFEKVSQRMVLKKMAG